jgi:F420-dependent oxidoreductase-like protein
MKLGLLLGYAGRHITLPMDLIKQAESLGYDSVWVAEAYGSDAVSVSSWILAQTEKIKVGTAIMQVPSRTPAATAMAAMSLGQMSGGRFILGLGASGPQVVEGWHGMPYNKPITRLREHIEIVKDIMARKAPTEYDGEIYQLPFKGEGAVGLGKPLKSILAPDELTTIYTASFTPAGFRTSGEVADGLFPAFASPEKLDIIAEEVEKGFDTAGNGKNWDNFDIAPFVQAHMSDNPEEARNSTRAMLALYVGGMGSRKKNFYNDMAKKMGYAEEAAKIQDLYLTGRKEEAAAAIPDEFIDEISLTGTRAQIEEKAAKWKEAERKGYVKTMILAVSQPELLPVLAEIFAD